MESRSEKYSYDDTNLVGSRSKRNEELYKNIGKTELSNYEVKSNAEVIGDNRNDIDIEKLKSILDTHYQDNINKKSLNVNVSDNSDTKTIFETKEYDINVVLDKAREVKEDDYEAERGKKLHDTQFDILKSLSEEEEPMEEDSRAVSKRTSQELTDLINTITINEKEIKEIKSSKESDDLFSDLKGGEETEVLDPINEETEDNDLEYIDDGFNKNEEKEEDNNDDFFTKSNRIKKKDYEEYEDLSEDEETSVFVKIIIFILVVLFIAGIIILVKSFI